MANDMNNLDCQIFGTTCPFLKTNEKSYIKIDWLIINGFTPRSRIFHLHGDVTIAGEGLQNLGLDARRSGPLSKEGSLSCNTYCDTGSDGQSV
jgi:hypothetical protein